MALKDIIDRIEERLVVVGKSAAAASEEAGLSRDAIRNWKRRLARGEDQAGMSIRTLEKLAVVLDTTVHYLQTGAEVEQQSVYVLLIPLLSWDDPSILRPDPVQLSKNGRVVSVIGTPELSSKDFFALRVYDNTMHLVSPMDSIILVDHADRRLIAHGHYVIHTPDGVFHRQFETANVWRALSNEEVPAVKGPVTVIGRVRKTELVL